ncbi:MAG: hypothetical protein Q8Q85_09750 [Gemmatimonadales bacterium]|nr:hypothetical protein [Gemmatimonadales bacterium]
MQRTLAQIATDLAVSEARAAEKAAKAAARAAHAVGKLAVDKSVTKPAAPAPVAAPGTFEDESTRDRRRWKATAKAQGKFLREHGPR